MCRMLQRLAIPVVLLAIAASAAGVDQCMQATPCSFTCKLACNATQPTHGQAQSVRIGRLLQNTSAGTDPEAMNDLITRVTAVAGNKFFTTTQQLQAGQYPVATKSDGSWETVSAGHWMSGFISGVCWQLYELTGGLPMWANMAQRWQKGLANKQREFASQHDFGEITTWKGPRVTISWVPCFRSIRRSRPPLYSSEVTICFQQEQGSTMSNSKVSLHKLYTVAEF